MIQQQQYFNNKKFQSHFFLQIIVILQTLSQQQQQEKINNIEAEEIKQLGRCYSSSTSCYNNCNGLCFTQSAYCTYSSYYYCADGSSSGDLALDPVTTFLSWYWYVIIVLAVLGVIFAIIGIIVECVKKKKKEEEQQAKAMTVTAIQPYATPGYIYTQPTVIGQYSTTDIYQQYQQQQQVLQPATYQQPDQMQQPQQQIQPQQQQQQYNQL